MSLNLVLVSFINFKIYLQLDIYCYYVFLTKTFKTHFSFSRNIQPTFH